MAVSRLQPGLFLVFLTFCSPAIAQFTSPDSFLAAVKKSLSDRSQKEFMALTYTTGQTPEQIDYDADCYKANCNDHFNKITSVNLGFVPGDYRSDYVNMGWRYHLLHPADGAVLIHKVGSDGTPIDKPEVIPYANINGSFYLIPVVGTILHWKGPEDHSLDAISEEGRYSKTVITIEWNASGLQQKWVVHSANAFVNGQFIEKVTMTSLDDDGHARLAIHDQEKTIYRSKWLNERGSLVYTKGVSSHGDSITR